MSYVAELGACIRRERLRRGMTQTELAQSAGLRTYVDLSRYENGHQAPRYDIIVALSQVLGLTLTELTGR